VNAKPSPKQWRAADTPSPQDKSTTTSSAALRTRSINLAMSGDGA
jgi:hypothetical protein